MKPYIFLPLFAGAVIIAWEAGKPSKPDPTPQWNPLSQTKSYEPIPENRSVPPAPIKWYKDHSQNNLPSNPDEWHPDPNKPLRPQLAIYASSEPEKAARLSLTIPPVSEDGDEAIANDPLGTVMKVWAKDSPIKAIDFHETIADPDRKRGSAVGLAQGLAENDVEIARSWVGAQIRGGAPDGVALISLVVPYMQPKKAESWIADLPLNENERAMTNGLVASRPKLQ